MELEKIRNLGDHELAVESRKAAEQLFRLRFQLTLGQTDAVKKVRLLRQDIARMRTVERERELGLHGAEHMAESVAPAESEKKPAKKAAAKKASHVSKARRGAPAAKKTAAKKTPAKKAAKKSTAKEAR